MAVISAMREYCQEPEDRAPDRGRGFHRDLGRALLLGRRAPRAAARANSVAAVNGEEIPFERFRRAQSNTIESYERMYASAAHPRARGAARPHRSRWSTSSSQEAVVVQRRGREGVRVSDEELRATIQQIRAFQRRRPVLPRALSQRAASRSGSIRASSRPRSAASSCAARWRRWSSEGVKVSDDEVQQAYR